MYLHESSVEFEKPAGFWQAVSYMHGQPEVGAVALRRLFDSNEVDMIREAGKRRISEEHVNPLLRLPNIREVKLAVSGLLRAHGIGLEAFHAMNRACWSKGAVEGMLLQDILTATPYGEGMDVHIDSYRTNHATIGAAISISIGHSKFAAALPPASLRTRTPESRQTHKDWQKYYRDEVDEMHYVELEPGDAAIYLQPGAHMVETEDQKRFAVVAITVAQV